MKYKVSFTDEIDASSPEQAYDLLLNYLKECCEFEDVTAFTFTDENGKEN